MKQYITTLIAIMALSTAAFASQSTLSVDVSKMSQAELLAYQRLAALQEANAKITPAEVSSWVGAGKEMGLAFKECWGAISNDVERFANSPAGKWTAFLVTWKIAGKDMVDVVTRVIRIGFSMSFAVVITIAGVFFYNRNCTARRVLAKTSKDKEGTVTKVYETVEGTHTSEAIIYPLAYSLIMLLLMLAAFA